MRSKSKWIIILGTVVAAIGLGLLIFTHVCVSNLHKHSAEIVSQAEKLLPEKVTGSVEDYSDTHMPVIEIDGEDVVGVIEFETLDLMLPVGNKWDKGISFPKRFSGSVYDNSLVIGGYYCDGQFDALTKLDIGNRISFTDMTGAQFFYYVADVKRTKSADAQLLNDENYDLTLFVRNPGSFEYIIVRCDN